MAFPELSAGFDRHTVQADTGTTPDQEYRALSALGSRLERSEKERGIFDAHRVHRTVHDMLRLRGYTVTTPPLTLDQFKEKLPDGVRDPNTFAIEGRRIVKGQAGYEFVLALFYDLPPPPPSATAAAPPPPVDKEVHLAFMRVRTLKEAMNRDGCDGSVRGVVVTRSTSISPDACLLLRDPAASMLEVLPHSLLRFPAPLHTLVPPHELMSHAERDAVVEALRIRREDFPRMRERDPIARFYGARAGDMFRIVRSSESGGQCFHYRMVV